jgi:integrase
VAVVRVKGIKEYTPRKGGPTYRYHRKSGVRINAELGTPAFFREIEAAEAKVKTKGRPRRGMLADLIKAYRASENFGGLKPRTRSDYDKVLNYLADIGELHLIDIDRPLVVKLRDRAFAQRKRSFANYVLAVLSILLEYGMERGDVKENVVLTVKKIRKRGDAVAANRPWTSAERDAVIAAAPLHLSIPVAISRWTGLRQGDVLKMPKTAYDGETIRLRTSKRGVPIIVPVAGPLKDLLDKAPPHNGITFCVNSRGRPWTEAGFRASFFKLIGRLEMQGVVGSGLTFHGLRHSVATELRELGFDTRTIADMLGQKTEAMAAHYAKEADLSAKMRGVVQRMERADAKRRK